jgi:hypothetical protein
VTTFDEDGPSPAFVPEFCLVHGRRAQNDHYTRRAVLPETFGPEQQARTRRQQANYENKYSLAIFSLVGLAPPAALI